MRESILYRVAAIHPSRSPLREFSASRYELLRIILLLSRTLWKSSQSRNNSPNHEYQTNNRPDHTPALARAAVSMRENAGIRLVDFSQDQVIALSLVSTIMRGKREE